MRRHVRTLRLAAAGVVALLACALLSACWPLSGPATIHVTAVVDDVNDMTSGAPVEMSDLPVGSVKSIRLDRSQSKAVLGLSVRKSAHVPADIQVRIRRTTPLGERFVDLEPRNRHHPGPPLRDGTVIGNTSAHPDNTVVVPDVQDLVQSGTDLFTALSANQIGVLVDQGAKAFGGNGDELHDLLAHLDDITSGYAGRTQTITKLVNDLDSFTASLAPSSRSTAQMFTNLAQTTQILSDQSNQFLDLVDSLNRLAGQTNSLLSAHFGHITDQIHGLQVLTDTVANQQRAFGNILRYLPGHNKTLSSGVPNDFLQVLLGVNLCGIPQGGEVANDPVNSCHYVPQTPRGN